MSDYFSQKHLVVIYIVQLVWNSYVEEIKKKCFSCDLHLYWRRQELRTVVNYNIKMVANIYEISFTDINFDPQKKPKRIVSCEDAIEEIGTMHFTLNPPVWKLLCCEYFTQ